MQCGGLARLLSVLQALPWLDFNMTDSHQVQTQMGDVGILPREDWNSCWHSESCTGDGHFTEMWVKTSTAQCERVGNVEETLSPSENILAHPEKRCLLQAGTPEAAQPTPLLSWSSQSSWKFDILFPHPDLDGLHCCFRESQVLLPAHCEGALQHSLKCRSTSHVFPELYTNQLLKWLFRAGLITALKDWAPEWYSTNKLGIFFPFNHSFLFAVWTFLSLNTVICSFGFWAATGFVLLVWGFFYVLMEAKSKQSNLSGVGMLQIGVY